MVSEGSGEQQLVTTIWDLCRDTPADRRKMLQSLHGDTLTNGHLHERQAEVVGSAAPVHRVLHDVEGKGRHLLIHQDAKVIT